MGIETQLTKVSQLLENLLATINDPSKTAKYNRVFGARKIY